MTCKFCNDTKERCLQVDITQYSDRFSKGHINQYLDRKCIKEQIEMLSRCDDNPLDHPELIASLQTIWCEGAIEINDPSKINPHYAEMFMEYSNMRTAVVPKISFMVRYDS